MLVCGPGWEKEGNHNSHGTTGPLKSSKPKRLYINRRFPGRGPAAFWALYPSLILAPAGLRVWWWKGLNAVASASILDGIYSVCIYSSCVMGFPWQQCMFQCVACGGALPYSLPLSGKSDHVSLPSYLSEWAPPGASLSFHVICGDKCLRPMSKILKHGSHWRHRRMESAPKTLGKVVAHQKSRPRPLSCCHLAPSLGWVLRATRWKDHRDIVHRDSAPRSAVHEAAGNKENLHEPGIIVLCEICLLVTRQTWELGVCKQFMGSSNHIQGESSLLPLS